MLEIKTYRILYNRVCSVNCFSVDLNLHKVLMASNDKEMDGSSHLYTKSCFVLLEEMCSEFQLESIYILERVSGESPNLTFWINLIVAKLGLTGIKSFYSTINSL